MPQHQDEASVAYQLARLVTWEHNFGSLSRERRRHVAPPLQPFRFVFSFGASPKVSSGDFGDAARITAQEGKSH